MQHILAAVLLAMCFAAGLWDVLVTYGGHPQDTVSNVIQQWSVMYPVLPLLIGLLIGHIFWPHQQIKLIKE
jgi:hypothetical protein